MTLESRLLLISVLAAQAATGEAGFRQKDARHYLDQFSNWVDPLRGPDFPRWHNTQVMRHMQNLIKLGYCRSSGSGRNQNYRLNRRGTLESLRRLRQSEGSIEFRQTLLSFYFLNLFRPRLGDLMSLKNETWTQAEQAEFARLIDPSYFLSLAIGEFETQIERLEILVNEGLACSEYLGRLSRQGEDDSRIRELAARAYPAQIEALEPKSSPVSELSIQLKLRTEIFLAAQLSQRELQLKVLRDLLRTQTKV